MPPPPVLRVPAAAQTTSGKAAETVEAAERLAGAHGDEARTVSVNLLRQQFGVLAGGERDDLELSRVRLDHRQRALADRAG